MFNPTPALLFDLKNEAERYRDIILNNSVEFALAYMGRYYDGREPKAPVPENFYVDFVKTVQSRILYDNPVIDISLRNSSVKRDAVRALEAGLNTLASRRHDWRMFKRVFLDMCISWGVVYTEFIPPRERTDEKQMLAYEPRSHRISPRRFFADPEADCFEPGMGECEYCGHMWIDYINALKRPKYNVDVIEQLASDAGITKYFDTDRPISHMHKMGRIIGYEIWVPGHHITDDPQAHGTIFTLAEAQAYGGAESPKGSKDGKTKIQSKDWIRPPRPALVPPDGMYSMFGYLPVPDSVYPLSYFASCHEQVKELNAHAVTLTRLAANRKRLILLDDRQKELEPVLKNARDLDVILAPGLMEGVVKEVTLGGADDAQFRFVDSLMNRAERHTGMSNNDRGQIENQATATAIAESAAMRDDRTAGFKSSFDDAVCSVYRNACWYMINMSSAFWSVSPDEANKLLPRSRFLPPESDAEKLSYEHGMDLETVQTALRHEPDVAFSGGPSDEVRNWMRRADGNYRLMVSGNVGGVTIDDLGFSIQAYSMERVSSAVLQRNMAWMWQIAIQALPMIQQFPEGADWPELFDRMGKAYNISDLGDLFRVDDVVRQARMQLMMAMQGGGSPQAGGMPGRGGQAGGMPGRGGQAGRMPGMGMGRPPGGMSTMAGQQSGAALQPAMMGMGQQGEGFF